MTAQFDAVAWLARFRELGGWAIRTADGRFAAGWPLTEFARDVALREHWRAIEHDEGRREEIRAAI